MLLQKDFYLLLLSNAPWSLLNHATHIDGCKLSTLMG